MAPRVIFVTSNEYKLLEASLAIREYGIELVMGRGLRKVEIQSSDLREIVEYAISLLCRGATEPLAIEDDGLFIESLGGFPGPYSSYVYSTIGLRGVLKLLEGLGNRRAYFMSVVGLCLPGKGWWLFEGVVHGEVAMEPRGSGGFGFDPIFIPLGHSRTFAEMGLEAKVKISHRTIAFRKMAQWLMDSSRRPSATGQ